MAFGPWEIVILLVILVIIFGAGRLSQVSGAVGKSVREFRQSVNAEPPAPPPVPAAPPITCAACQASNPATNKFCSSCGATLMPAIEAPHEATPVVVQENTCPSCATVNPPGQPFCGQCGTRLTTAAA